MTTTNSNDLFGNSSDSTVQPDLVYDPNTNYVAQLVGEGKKFHGASEQEAYNKLAFSKLEADRFIQHINSQKDEMRQELNTRRRVEDMLTQLTSSQQQQQQKLPPSNDDNQDNERGNVMTHKEPTMVGLTPDQTEAIVEAKLRERANMERSVAGIQKILGADYKITLNEEAKKLNLSTEFVNQLAKTNPDAFIKLFDKPQAQVDTRIPSSSINSSSLSSGKNLTGERTKSYYKELKRTDPVKYASKEVQLQEYKDAIRLGEAFFDTE